MAGLSRRAALLGGLLLPFGAQSAPLLLGAGGAALGTGSGALQAAGTVSSGGGATYAGAKASDIAGLTAWYDMGSAANLLTSGGTAAGYVTQVASVANSVSGGPALALGNSSTWIGKPHLVGLKAGLGAVQTARGQTNAAPGSPLLDLAATASTSTPSLGSGQARTVYMVWTRPTRQAQPYATPIYPVGPLTMISIGGTTVLTMSNNGDGADVLSLNGTSLTTTLERRHTHSITLAWSAGGGIDVWLDDTQVATGLSNPVTSSASGLSLGGAPGLYWHEVAVWDHKLSGAELTTMFGANGVSQRWLRGARRGQIFLSFGQSNASNFENAAWEQWIEAVRYHLCSCSVSFTSGGTYTPHLNGGFNQSGSRLYDTSTSLWLRDLGDSTPANWPLGSMGTSSANAIASMSAADRAEVAGLVWYWSEADSSHTYPEKALFKAARAEYWGRARASIGKPASQVPVLDISALPFTGGVGGAPTDVAALQMIREAESEQAATSALNAWIVLPNTSDAWGNGGVSDASPGESGHLDAADQVRQAYLAGPVVARAVVASGGADSGHIIPTGIAQRGGPLVTAALRETATSVLVTVQHEAGTDLRLPGTATSGTGWTVFDGWTDPTASGTARLVSTVARVSATQLRLTLASAMTNAAASCRLFYGAGDNKIGRGSAVTDNYSSVTKPAAFDIAADLGAAWCPDCPLAVTMAGLVLS